MRWFASGLNIAKMGPFGSEEEARESMRLRSETDEEYARHVRSVAMANAVEEATHRRLIRAGAQIPARQPREQMRGGFPLDLKVWSE